jgi:hypothetical protein
VRDRWRIADRAEDAVHPAGRDRGEEVAQVELEDDALANVLPHGFGPIGHGRTHALLRG